jgi:hypothetical protein
VGLANLGIELEKCVGSRVRLVGVSISFEKNFYRLPFTPLLSGSPYWSFSVVLEGEIKVSDKITLRRVDLVQSLGYNLLSVSQLLDQGFEVLFQPGVSRILDSREDLICMVVPEGQVFRSHFSQSSGVERCFLVGSLSELWKWHRKLGHLSFDLLSLLSKLDLVRGLTRLRFEKELVCAPCRHAKMVASSHPPLTDVMTERLEVEE